MTTPQPAALPENFIFSKRLAISEAAQVPMDAECCRIIQATLDYIRSNYALAALQSQPAEVSDDDISIAAAPFAWKNLNVTEHRTAFARAILALRPQSESEARRAAQEQLYTERERHTAEVKRLQAEIGRLQSERPQAVPMTRASRDAIMAARTADGDADEWPEPWAYRRGWEDAEAHHGITAPAGGEKQA